MFAPTAALTRLQRLLDISSDPENPEARTLLPVIRRLRRIAVVGLSRDPGKAARRVPSYLATKGLEVIPVNPNADRILGRTSHNRIEEVEEELDLVLVFRPSEEAGGVIASVLPRPEKPVIWLQEGIRADQEAAEARSEGHLVVQDLCLFKAHRAVSEDPSAPELRDEPPPEEAPN